MGKKGRIAAVIAQLLMALSSSQLLTADARAIWVRVLTTGTVM